MPNNPWHMIEYIEDMLQQMKAKVESGSVLETDPDQSSQVIDGMQQSLDKLKPIVEAHDKEFQELQTREQEMERFLHEFKNSLMIEKIKMDSWENRQKLKNNEWHS